MVVKPQGSTLDTKTSLDMILNRLPQPPQHISPSDPD